MTITSAATAEVILNRVAAEVGLTPLVGGNAYTTSEPSYVQLRHLLNSAGEELTLVFPWEFLQRTHTITVVAGQRVYDLPADYSSMINQTQWDVGQQRRMIPTTSQTFKAYSVNNVGTLDVMFRVRDGRLELVDQLATGTLLTFDYTSISWVVDGLDPLTRKDFASNPSDLVLFNRRLVTLFVKAKWLEAAGFDTAKAQADFNQTFAFVTGKDTPAPVLNLGGRSAFRLVDGENAPYTGFGQ